MKARTRVFLLALLVVAASLTVWKTSERSIYEDPYGALQDSVQALKSRSRDFSNRFKSQTDQDEKLLPETLPRRRIYTYFDGNWKKEVFERKLWLVSVWRRAMYAAGFEPVVLSVKDARRHARYNEVTAGMRGIPTEEYMGVLALAAVGGEILIDFSVMPMGTELRDETLLYLLKHTYSKLVAYEQLPGKLYTGNTLAYEQLVAAFAARKSRDKESVFPLHDKFSDLFELKTLVGNGLADYSDEVVREMYPDLAKTDLPALVEAHLHENFLRNRPDGICVLDLNLESRNSRVVMNYAEYMARQIATCPHTPLPKSCPPNIKDCEPCARLKSSNHIRRRKSILGGEEEEMFCIAVVPHPYDSLALQFRRSQFTPDFIVRKTEKNRYLRIAADAADETSLGPHYFVEKIKSLAVTQPTEPLRWFWIIWEQVDRYDHLPALLGFPVPPNPSSPLMSYNKAEMAMLDILEDASNKIARTSWHRDETCEQVEKWNLEDYDLWKMIRAVAAREERDLKKLRLDV